jgi:alpha-galactosidase
VFGTQKLLAKILKFYEGIEADRTEIKTNIVGINHFTWLTSAQYKNIGLFPLYRKYIEEHPEGWDDGRTDHWVKVMGGTKHLVKFDLFKRYGYIAAAGDRHLAEFCEAKWYLESPKMVEDWEFGLTTVDKRIYDYQVRDEKGKRLMNGEKAYFFTNTGEEGVLQMRALLGLTDSFVTNINIPNKGQIPNLPLDAVVETNACITSDSVAPVYAGNVPMSIYGMIARIVGEQETVVEAGLKRDLELAFSAFANSQNVNLTLKDARALFDEMVQNTKEYLKDYNV